MQKLKHGGGIGTEASYRQLNAETDALHSGNYFPDFLRLDAGS